MGRFIDRLVIRGFFVLAAAAVLAFTYNHHTQPCTDAQVGAGGMCVTVSAGGAR